MKNAFTINRLSEMFEHDRRRITRTLSNVEPVAHKGRSKLYTCRQYHDAMIAGADDGEALDLTRERALLARAQRKLTEQNFERGQATRSDLAWQSKVVDVIALHCGLSARQMGAWLVQEFGDRNVTMRGSKDALRELAMTLQGWGLGAAHQLKQDLAKLAEAAENREQLVTEYTQLLKMLGRDEAKLDELQGKPDA